MLAEASPIWPSIWSAIASTSSAIAAVTLMGIHIKNREDSVRPELILEKWGFTDDSYGMAKITIGKVRNEGRGPFLHMWGKLSIPGTKPIGEGGPFKGFFHDPVSFLGIGKELDVDWSIRFEWKGSSTLDLADPIAPIHLSMFVFDIHGRLHETKYELIASKSGMVGGVTNLAPGLTLSRRHTFITPTWKLHFRSRKHQVRDSVNHLNKQIKDHKIYKEFKERVLNPDNYQ